MTSSYFTPSTVQAIARDLSDREHSVLVSLSTIRVATAAQLERLHFADVGARERRRVLERLAHRKLLYRFARSVGGPARGSSGFIYGLGVGGQRLMQTDSARRMQQPWTPGHRFLAHALTVSELYTQLREAERRSELTVRIFQGEPACWRPYFDPSGARVLCKPDAYVSLQLGEHVDHWFVEVDKATQSPRTLTRKCDAYRSYFASGTEQHRYNVFPKVLFTVPDAARQATLIDVIAAQPVDAWPLFAVCEESDALTRLRRGAEI